MLLNPDLLNPRRRPPNLRQRHLNRHLAIDPDQIQRLAHHSLIAISQSPYRLILPGPERVPVRQDPGPVCRRDAVAAAGERLAIRISPAVVVAVDHLGTSGGVEIGRGGRFVLEVVGRDFGEGGLQVREHEGPGRGIEGVVVAPGAIVRVVPGPVSGVESAVSSWEPGAVT